MSGHRPISSPVLPEVILLNLRIAAVNHAQVRVGADILTAEQHVNNQVLPLEEQRSRDGSRLDRFCDYVGEVSDARDASVVELEPCVELLRVEVGPVVPAVVDYHAAHHVSRIAGT